MSKVSIIIPSYNHIDFLEDRIYSILKQTYQNWELIIIDDASSDSSVSKIENLLLGFNAKIKYFIINSKNSGSGYKSWKKGIELAETDFIWIAETDDFCEFTFLEDVMKVYQKNLDISLVFSSSIYVNERKEFLYDSLKRTKSLNVADGDFSTFDGSLFLSKACTEPYIINASSVVFKKPNNKEIPPEIFKKGLSSDIFLWSYLVRESKFGFINKKLNYFRRHDNSTTEKFIKSHEKQIYTEKIKYLNFFKMADDYNGFLKSYISNYVWANKNEFFNSKFLNKLETKDFVQLEYFRLLLAFSLKRIQKKLCNE